MNTAAQERAEAPLVSVIVPVYNTAPWLRRCLDSICAQSYRNLEILCVNDGSTDNSAEILAEYAAKDARIRVIHQENAGLSAARNTALEHATGEWVTGVDSDDYLLPGAYERVSEYCKPEVSIVYFGVQEVYDDGTVLPPCEYFSLPEPGEYEMTPELANRLNVCFWSKLWRRSLLEAHQLRFPAGLVHEDEALLYISAPYIRRLAVCPAVGYAYLLRDGSIMKGAGLDELKRLRRYLPMLEFVHREYEKRGLMGTPAQAYLLKMFMYFFCGYYTRGPGAQKEVLMREIRGLLSRCSITRAHYSLERFITREQKGVFCIYRFKHAKVFTIAWIPVWLKLYTNYGWPVTLLTVWKAVRKLLSLLICR